MRPVRLALAAALVAGLAMSAPADAAQIHTRDGRVLDGDIRVEGPGLAIRTADGKIHTVPYDQVLGISLDNQPLFPPPRRLEESKYLNNDFLVWSVVGANLAAIALAGVAVWRATNGVPAGAAGTTPAR